MLIVLDTNILVSALWSRNGTPARILSLVLSGACAVCFDHRILEEYRTVLSRPKFRFTQSDVDDLLKEIEQSGISVLPNLIAEDFADESDRKFLEVARFCNAFLITGNMKRFPPDPLVLSAADFLSRYGS